MPLDQRERDQCDELRTGDQDARRHPLAEALEPVDVDRADGSAQEADQRERQDVVGDDAGQQSNRQGDDDPESGIHQGGNEQRHRRHWHQVLRVGIDGNDKFRHQ